MKSSIFILPGVALPTLETAIRAYYLAKREGLDPINTSELVLFVETLQPKYRITSRETSTSFLCATGIMRSINGEKYSLTDLGIRLGRAIKDFQEELISVCWSEAIGYCNFIRDFFYNYIQPINSFEQEDLKKEIVHSAGRAIKKNSLIGAHCIVDIMERGGYILKKRDGRDITILVNQKKFRPSFIRKDLIDVLRQTPNGGYDLRKLIRLCEEINLCYESQCYYAVGILSRAIIDHVPPVFGFDKFHEVVTHYKTGTRSFRENMESLNEYSRKISDSYLHTTLKIEQEPANSAQVSFSPSFDVLLSEIIKLLNRPEEQR